MLKGGRSDSLVERNVIFVFQRQIAHMSEIHHHNYDTEQITLQHGTLSNPNGLGF